MVLLTSIVAQKCHMNKAKKLKKNTTIIFFDNYRFFFSSLCFYLFLFLFIIFIVFIIIIDTYIYVVGQQYQKPIRIKIQARLSLVVFLSCLCQQQRDCLRQSLTYKTARHSSETKIYGCIRIEGKTAISNQRISLFLQNNITSI